MAVNSLLSMEVTGVARVELAIKKKTNQYARGVARGVSKIGKLILDESRKIVPVDEWVLHNTSRVKESGRGFHKMAEVIYNQEYAAKQHEDLEYEHKPGRSAKYLEKPIRQNNQKMKKIAREEALKP